MSLKDYINNMLIEHHRAAYIDPGFCPPNQENNKLWDIIHEVWNFAWDTEVRLAALEKAAKPVEEPKEQHDLKLFCWTYTPHFKCQKCQQAFRSIEEFDTIPCHPKPTEAEKPKPKKKIVRWVNVYAGYAGGEILGMWDNTRCMADKNADVMQRANTARIARKRVEIEFEEGELDE